MVRLPLTLADTSHWLKLFDPRGGGLFVPTDAPPEAGAEVRVDLVITPGGPRVILRGTVLWRRVEGELLRDPPGCVVGLSIDEREKVNFINGFVRGGLINRRERRRLPLRLPVVVAHGAERWSLASRDVNEEGIFVVTEQPLPEETAVVLEIGLPEAAAPLVVRGIVGHTVIPEDEDVPGMGIRFQLGEEEAAAVSRAIDALERAFYIGTLPEDVIS